MSKKLALISVILALIISNLIIISKENTVQNGEIVLLRLRPVDPRSLMQGDYMALRFNISNEIKKHSKNNKDGFVILQILENNVGVFKRLYSGEKLSNGEIKLKYRIRNDIIKFATNAYFFEEGTGTTFNRAEYGQFRVDKKGEMILTNLIDADFNIITVDKTLK